ncbi:MAG: chromosome segregation protein SMC [Betaproteobacteria bacterium]|nr:chromosome segregation protein SMC [Betaproteobacteria bacterium]
MRLTQINLAGFKSFVDPAHIPIPGRLVGIVGPNGCGKSNVIDAVRWVLGETSARHLRGETMQDVLFNGSGERKPVNRASVELIFDNSLGKAAGQWSSYAEISIKRVLQRDGDSSYYINNLHVRRRDVADIFFGTGLGGRAYAIIEQGMISRVIESKPEELRIFLEEAAGVSKYRERRRETEVRLESTRDNLLRVDDIRQELARQIGHLEVQAEVARRFHGLQGELQKTQSLLWLTRKQEAAATRARHAREVERLGVELEAETARMRDAERRLEELRVGHHRAGDEMHAAHGALYEANAETARLEQDIAHVRDSRQRIENQLAAARAQLENGQSQLDMAQAELAEWQATRARAEERISVCAAAEVGEAEKLPVAEETYRATRSRRDEFQSRLSQIEQVGQVEQTKLEHAWRLAEQLGQRRERLLEERAALAPSDSDGMVRLQQEIQSGEQDLAARRAALGEKEQGLLRFEQSLREKNEALDAAAQQLTELEARRHALQQLQDRLARGANMEGWLARYRLQDTPRVWQGISIEPGWEDALEAVLRERLNGITLDRLERSHDWFGDAPPGRMTVVAAADVQPAALPGMPELKPLLQYLTCGEAGLKAALAEWLHDVFVVDDVSRGMELCGRLPAGAVLVSREGHVFTQHSINFYAPDSELHGVLSRQREIEELRRATGVHQVELDVLREAAAAVDFDIGRAKDELGALRRAVDETQQRTHDLELESLRLSEQAQRITQRGQQIATELQEVSTQLAEETARAESAGTALTRLQAQAEELRRQFELSTDLYGRADAVLRMQRDALQKAQIEHQEASFSLRAAQLKIAEVENAIRNASATVAGLREGIGAQECELGTYDDAPLQERLQQALANRARRELALAQARDALEGLETRLKEVEQERFASEQKLDPLRERISGARLREQEARLIEEQFAQQLAAAGAREDELGLMLEKGVRSGALQGEIARLNEEIQALGAVNLAALEELQASQERKAYLDAQSRDLSEAMGTLEDAIRRIDRETRERLQQTFDDVNRHFGEMFPALFGGGHARMVLTGEEILDSGVHVVAQPPGKRNTTIHLLSGGEKALTALSLVFALFQLNPAPFCLLDEVDAPLDDHNTERFCDLVRKMSAQSQFVFISHNKITMEIANQLLGITMQEAGVSRVVAVDIEEAMKLTEEAA